MQDLPTNVSIDYFSKELQTTMKLRGGFIQLVLITVSYKEIYFNYLYRDSTILIEIKLLWTFKIIFQCPPCKAFTPQLVEYYRKIKSRGHKFEIIFVSSDRQVTHSQPVYSCVTYTILTFTIFHFIWFLDRLERVQLKGSAKSRFLLKCFTSKDTAKGVIVVKHLGIYLQTWMVLIAWIDWKFYYSLKSLDNRLGNALHMSYKMFIRQSRPGLPIRPTRPWPTA